MANEDFVGTAVDKASRREGKEDPQVRIWLQEIADATKREKDWKENAQRTQDIYEGCKGSLRQTFNILYSNTETLSPAVYNNVPRPVVRRRYNDEDKLGKTISDIIRRCLVYTLDNDIEDYPTFHDAMKFAVLNALVPGRGQTWFEYKPTFEPAPLQGTVGADESAPGTPGQPADGEVASEEQLKYEAVCVNQVSWDQFLHGYGQTWNQVPWVARPLFMSREELVQNFGEVGKKVKLDARAKSTDGDKDKSEPTLNDAEGAKLALVWEIWDKATKKVRFLAPSYPMDFLKVVDDPLQLAKFFPCPKPLFMFDSISSLVPKILYSLYEEQAKELNTVSLRIIALINMMKVRGFYDSTVEKIEQVLQAEDGTLIAAENVAALAAGGGKQALDNAIWLMPLSEIVAAVQQLFVEREATKKVIYEITGISDILRGGGTAASESATAQDLKSQWGTLRLKRMQSIVQIYARDCLRLMAEIICKHFSQETISAMTGLKYPTQQEKMMVQQKGQMLAQQAQMTGQPPPPPSPEEQQIMTLPSWEEIMSILRDDITRSYRIDIETNSTVDAEATEDKQDMGELLNAIAQFMNGVAPLIEQGLLNPELMKGMLLAVVRRYKFGPEIEDQLANMTQPQQGPKEDPAAQAVKAKAEAEMQATQMDLAMKQKEMEMKEREMQMEMRLKQLEMQMKEMEMRHKMVMQQEQSVLDREEFAMKRQQSQQQAMLDKENMVMKGEQQRQQHALSQQKAQQQAQQAKQKPRNGDQR